MDNVQLYNSINLLNTVNFLTNFLTAYSLYKFYGVFFDTKKPLWLTLIVYISYTVITSTVYFLFKTPAFTGITSFVLTFSVTFIYKTSLRKKLMSFLFIYLTFITLDTLIALFVGYTLTPMTQKNEFVSIPGIIIVRFSYFFAAILAQNIKNVKTNVRVSIIYWFAAFLIPLASIYLMVVIYNTQGISNINLIMLIIAIMGINALVFYLYSALLSFYNHKLEAMLFKKEKEFYFNQCEIMQTSANNLQSFSHDIKNHLMVLNSFIDNNKTEESKKYLSELIGKMDIEDVFSSTGNITFDSIINYKLTRAKEKGIDVLAEIKIPEELEVNTTDIVIIIGNLLDNAINAAIRAENKKLSLKINYSKGRLLIHIENTFDGLIKYDENGDIVTIQNKDTNGFGLKNVRSAIDKYNGVLTLSNSETIFTADVLLYVV